MPSKNPKPPAPKIGTSKVAPHPDPKDPKHAEWLIDEAEDESFPASDPSSATQPKPKPRKAGPR
jgi:hypothetical protein